MERFVVRYSNINSALRFRSGRVSLADANNYHDNTSSVLHSDTIYSAIINHTAQLYGYQDAAKMADLFKNNQLGLTSMNIFIENKESDIRVWFMPVPVSNVLFNSVNKRFFKSIKFISSYIYQNTNRISDWEDKNLYVLLPGGLLVTKIEMNNLFGLNPEKMITPLIYKIRTKVQNSIHNPEEADKKHEGDAQLYTQTFVEINNKLPNNVQAGLYFIIELNSLKEEDFKWLKKILEQSGTLGFGGERNNLGRFEITEMHKIDIKNELGDLFLKVQNSAQYFMNLGLFSPQSSSEFLNCIYYQAECRGGQMDSEERRPLMQMIKEGAIFTCKPQGAILEFKKDIFRYGNPICIPLRQTFIPNWSTYE